MSFDGSAVPCKRMLHSPAYAHRALCPAPGAGRFTFACVQKRNLGESRLPAFPLPVRTPLAYSFPPAVDAALLTRCPPCEAGRLQARHELPDQRLGVVGWARVSSWAPWSRGALPVIMRPRGIERLQLRPPTCTFEPSPDNCAGFRVRPSLDRAQQKTPSCRRDRRVRAAGVAKTERAIRGKSWLDLLHMCM